MKVEYTLTPEDYLAAMRERLQRPPGFAKWVATGGALLVFLVQVVVLVVQNVHWPVVLGVSVFFGVLFFVSIWLIQPLIHKRLIAGALRQARVSTSQSLEVRPDGLAVTTDKTASLTSWDGIDRIVVTGTHAFLGNQILPRRAFADDRAFEEFVERARSFHAAARPEDQPAKP